MSVNHKIKKVWPYQYGLKKCKNLSKLTCNFSSPTGTGESHISSDSYSMDDSHISAQSDEAAEEQVDRVDPNVDGVYKKTLIFLEETEDLKLAPETLKGQVQELEKMGNELSDSIGQFKEQSFYVASQSTVEQ